MFRMHLVLQNMGRRTADTVDQRTFEQLTGKLFRFLVHLSSTFVMQGFIVLRNNREESCRSLGKHLVLQNMGGRTADTVDQRTFEQLTGKLFCFLAHLSSTFVMQGFIVLRQNREESLSLAR